MIKEEKRTARNSSGLVTRAPASAECRGKSGRLRRHWLTLAGVDLSDNGWLLHLCKQETGGLLCQEEKKWGRHGFLAPPLLKVKSLQEYVLCSL